MTSDKVATEEERQLHEYEMVLIISPEISDEQSEARIGSVTKYIDDNGGVVSDIERWGKRRLAYPIRHFVEGSYVLVKFSLGPMFGSELEANLRISDEVLRHLLIRLDS